MPEVHFSGGNSQCRPLKGITPNLPPTPPGLLAVLLGPTLVSTRAEKPKRLVSFVFSSYSNLSLTGHVYFPNFNCSTPLNIWRILGQKTDCMHGMFSFNRSLIDCSRLQDSGESASRKAAGKPRGSLGETGNGACKHFFQYIISVYQLLVYPVIGQFWQLTSSMSIGT